MYSQEILNEKVHELRRLKAEAAKLSEQISQIESDLKSEMEAEGVYELSGDDWKITWNMVTSNRFNQSMFKKAHPEMFDQYITESSSRRFLLS